METYANAEYERLFGKPVRLPTYWLTRFVILRMVGAIYAFAFLVAIHQVVPLIGANGLTPVDDYLTQIGTALGSRGAGFWRLPSLFWCWHSNAALLVVAWAGFFLSLLITFGYANVPVVAVTWFFYLSFVHVGQEWYGYGWEVQLNETGFLSIFLCPLLDLRPFPRKAPPVLLIVLFRWLACRAMLGAGLIKLRGDDVWRNSTALYYYFQSQPIPGPLSRWFHFLPPVVLRLGVWFNWLAELVAPLFVFWPRAARYVAGLVIVAFQFILILSGNLSFLNWLTIVPALACFDDAAWAKVLPASLVRRATRAAALAAGPTSPVTAAGVLTVLVAILSIQPTINMLSPGQVMNANYDPFDVVNTYGAFGTVGKERLNVVFEGTRDNDPSDKAAWRPYPYKGLPVLPGVAPPQVAPYQLRLDWQMWFAAMATPEQYPWTVTLVQKLLKADRAMLGLFGADPFAGERPRYVRAALYRYWFAEPGSGKGVWWKRQRLGLWIPAMALSDFHLPENKRAILPPVIIRTNSAKGKRTGG